MMHTFATREEAAVFASAMRANGHYAEILDEGMGAIYGPLAIGGVRVIVSEAAADPADESDDAEIPPSPGCEANDTPGKRKAIDELLDALRLTVVSVAACGLIICMVAAVKWVTDDPWLARGMFYPLLKYALSIAVLFALMGPCMDGFTRWVRGDCSSIPGRAIRWLFLAIAVPFVLLLVL